MTITLTRLLIAAPLLAGALGLLASPGCVSDKKGTGTVVIPAPPAYDTAKALRYADLGLVAQRQGKYDEAIENYRLAIEANPELSGVWTNLGVAFMAKQNFTSAAEAFKKAADLSPTDSRPLVNLGIAYLDRGWADEALTYFARALDRDPNNVDALRGAVTAAQRCGKEDEVDLDRIKHLQLLETDPKWKMELGFRRARIEQNLRDRGRAVNLSTSPSPELPPARQVQPSIVPIYPLYPTAPAQPAPTQPPAPQPQ